MQWVIFTPSILGGFIIGFTDIRYPTDLIRGASIGHIATELLQNSALILSVGLRTPIFGGDIPEVEAELYAISLVIWLRQRKFGGASLGFKAASRPESTDLAKSANTGRHRPRRHGGIPPCAQGFV